MTATPRDIIQRHDPDRAARLNRLDPQPLPCTCEQPSLIDVRTFGSVEPIARVCTRCGRRQA